MLPLRKNSHRPQFFSREDQAGFSLVEVVLALGITTVGIFAFFGLMQLGLHANQDSSQESQAISIIQSMVIDRRTAPPNKSSTVFGIAAFTAGPPSTFFITESGTVTPTAAGARFRVVVSQESAPTAPTNPAPTYLLFHASWPAPAPAANSWVEIVAAFPTS